jgi:hypothetical protein
MKDYNHMLNIGETAKLLGVCENTLRKWDEDGYFAATKTIGGHRRYSMEKIRNYLNENQKEEELILWEPEEEKIPDITNSKNLSILLENCELFYEQQKDTGLSVEDLLWLTENIWNKSKFIKLISVQAAKYPASLIFYQADNNSLKSDAVAVRTLKFNTPMFSEKYFNYMKEIYAEQLAKEIDIHIMKVLYKKNKIDVNVIIDCDQQIILNQFYDYIAASKHVIANLKNRNNIITDNVELIEIECVDAEFKLMAIGGKYLTNVLTLPICVPYNLVYIGPMLETGLRSFLTRIAFYEG